MRWSSRTPRNSRSGCRSPCSAFSRAAHSGEGVVGLAAAIALVSADAPSAFLIAHRGASAYAPEHTLDAYRLAIEQGADYVELDLCLTKDNALVVSHDPTLERTTNVEQIFPDRFTSVTSDGKTTKHWFIEDFTLAEVKQLDNGA